MVGHLELFALCFVPRGLCRAEFTDVCLLSGPGGRTARHGDPDAATGAGAAAPRDGGPRLGQLGLWVALTLQITAPQIQAQEVCVNFVERLLRRLSGIGVWFVCFFLLWSTSQPVNYLHT